jgi:hypothetical protein
VKCFHHPADDAVGLCKSCGKGLCKTCAVDLGEGLACADSCEVAVRDLIMHVRVSRQALQSTPAAYKTQSTVGFLAGAAFVAVGATSLLTPIGWVAPVFLIMAAPMLYQGLRARRMYRSLVEARKQLTS